MYQVRNRKFGKVIVSRIDPRHAKGGTWYPRVIAKQKRRRISYLPMTMTFKYRNSFM